MFSCQISHTVTQTELFLHPLADKLGEGGKLILLQVESAGHVDQTIKENMICTGPNSVNNSFLRISIRTSLTAVQLSNTLVTYEKIILMIISSYHNENRTSGSPLITFDPSLCCQPLYRYQNANRKIYSTRTVALDFQKDL